MATSYYRFIDGVRYDRELLEAADSLTDKPGDGRFSFEDAQKLWEMVRDGRGITETELDTLRYIRVHFNWTEKAADWIDEKLDENMDMSIESIIRQIVEDEFDLPGLETNVEENEVKIQQFSLENEIDFDDALRLALKSFLEDGQDVESPRNLVMEAHEIFKHNFDSEESWENELDAKVMEYFSEGIIDLIPLEMPENEFDWEFNPPQNGESVQENWIFHLYLPNLSDHGHWAVVDRKGEKSVYNYGFN